MKANTRPPALTNLILVLGYMDALGITEVHPLKVNQADGLLTAREFLVGYFRAMPKRSLHFPLPAQPGK